MHTALEKAYHVSVLPTPHELDEHIHRSDLVLLDCNFTENNGIDCLMDILSRAHVPVLMVTPLDDPQCAIEAMRLGAGNFVVKTHN